MSLSPNLTIKELFLQACTKGNLELARVLLANGAAVNWVDDLGSGLHKAARSGHGELLDLLLAQPGVEVNIKNGTNRTPLMLACLRGKENLVKKLRQVEGIQVSTSTARKFLGTRLFITLCRVGDLTGLEPQGCGRTDASPCGSLLWQS